MSSGAPPSSISPATRRTSKPSSLERPLPLAGLDRHAVGAAEPERDGDGLRRHALDDRRALSVERRRRRAAVRRVEHGAGDGVGLLLRPHDRRTRHELLRRRHDEHDGDDRDVVRADPDDLRVVDVDALGRGLELAQRVDGRGRDEAVAGGRRDRSLGEADGLVVVARERDADERAQPVRLRR